MVENNKWIIASSGIQGFIHAPESAGLSVALQLFSVSVLPPGGGCAACDGSDCAIPRVAAGLLPDNATAIDAALAITPFGSGTPLEAPLRGGLTFCSAVKGNDPRARCAVVVVTDGIPTTCVAETDGLAQIASAGYSNGIQTFMVGMTGADYVMLDGIAVGGGTDCTPAAPSFACDATDAGALTASLERIRDMVGKCAVP